MVTKIRVFEHLKLVKVNPWASGNNRFTSIVNEGLARPKKSLILASPPPWFGNPELLNEYQRRAVEEFKRVARRQDPTRKESLRERLLRIKRELSGEGRIKRMVEEEKRRRA